MRSVAASALAIAALLGAAATAHAWAPPPSDDAARLAPYLPIARAAWPSSPCAGREVVHVGVGADQHIAEQNTANGEPSIGRANPPTCEIWVHTGLSAGDFCDTVVHEDGHNAGYGHTGVPGDVQAPAGPQADIMAAHDTHWPACVTATTPPPTTARAQAETYIRQALPWDGYGWRVNCTPMRGRPTCRARHTGARDRRFRVRLDAAGRVMWADQISARR